MPRSREHIIPYSLSGNWVIQDASCASCADITSKIEARCSRGFFSEIRTHLELSTRRKKRRPEALVITEVSKSGEIQFSLPVKDHPYRFTTVDLEPCTYLGGKDASETTHVRAVAIKFQQDYERRISLLGSGSFAHDSKIDYLALYALLAKIAHAYAAAELGHGSYQPLLLDVIYGKPVPVSTYIGGTGVIGEMTPWNVIHRCRVFKEDILGIQHILCDVQLFSNLGAPIYRIAVGRSINAC
ncbi:hypothetical protein [Sulfurirhabdus autotrophica]